VQSDKLDLPDSFALAKTQNEGIDYGKSTEDSEQKKKGKNEEVGDRELLHSEG
jgi:hypothetical protein